MTGWIKIHRVLLDWEWYTDPNTMRLFIHLLLNANNEPKKWKGIDLKPGELVIGRVQLAKDLKLSERKIRTSMERLKSTKEIAIKSTNKYSIVTICNWGSYQEMKTKQRPAVRPTAEPSSDQQTTTAKESKNKEDMYRAFAHLKLSIIEFNELIQIGYSKEEIDNTLDSIENYKKNTQYNSLFLTIKKWLKKERLSSSSKEHRPELDKPQKW